MTLFFKDALRFKEIFQSINALALSVTYKVTFQLKQIRLIISLHIKSAQDFY